MMYHVALEHMLYIPGSLKNYPRDISHMAQGQIFIAQGHISYSPGTNICPRDISHMAQGQIFIVPGTYLIWPRDKYL
jgi:hypothetical protein